MVTERRWSPFTNGKSPPAARTSLPLSRASTLSRTPTTIADLLWLTTVIAFICYVVGGHGRLVQFEGAFSSLPPSDEALRSRLARSGWVVDAIERRPPTGIDIHTSPRVAARLQVTARSRYTTDGRFEPAWEDLGYTGYQLRGVWMQPEPWRVGIVLLLWSLICVPTAIRRWRDRRSDAAWGRPAG